jgi:phage terminase small subunit
MASEKEKKDSPLSDKQKVFCREYLKDLNASQAAIRAGYSKVSAGQQSALLMKDPRIAEKIKIGMDKRIDRTHVTIDRVVTELARMAFSDVTEFMEWSENVGKIKDSIELTPDQSACIKEVLIEDRPLKGKKIRVKLVAKEKALELLMRHMGMMNDNVNVNVVTLGDFARECEKADEDPKDDTLPK